MAEEYRNAAEAETKGHYLFRPSNGDDCILPAGTPALLHRSQAPFRMPHDDSEWVTITPLVVQEYYAGGERRERCVTMLEGSHPRIVIPTIHIRKRARIIRDFVPGVPEHDHIAAIGAAKIHRKRSSQRGRCDMGQFRDVAIHCCRASLSETHSPGSRAMGGGFPRLSLIRPVWYSTRTRTRVKPKVMNTFHIRSGFGARSLNGGPSTVMDFEYQAVRRKPTRAEQDMANKDGLVGDSFALNTPKILANRNVPSSIHLALVKGFP